ncbi:hypothetical protein GGER_08020 [Serratia rubidaea]
MSLHSKSESLYAEAQQLIPGGVNSPVRAFTGVGGVPLFIERADGAYLFDADGKAYIDYVGSWGPMVLGHNHPAIRNAVICRRRTRPEFWRADRNGSKNGRAGDRTGADDGYGAHGELRHRSHHERHPPGARLHPAR